MPVEDELIDVDSGIDLLGIENNETGSKQNLESILELVAVNGPALLGSAGLYYFFTRLGSDNVAANAMTRYVLSPLAFIPIRIYAKAQVGKKFIKRRTTKPAERQKLSLKTKIGTHLTAGAIWGLAYTIKTKSIQNFLEYVQSNLESAIMFGKLKYYELTNSSGFSDFSNSSQDVEDVAKRGALHIGALASAYLLSYVLVENNRRLFARTTPKMILETVPYILAELSGDSKKQEEILRRHAKKDPGNFVILLKSALKKKDYNSAFQYASELAAHKTGVPFKIPRSDASEIFDLERKLRKNPNNIETNMELALIYLGIGGTDTTKYFFWRCEALAEKKEDPRRIDYSLLHSQYLASVQPLEEETAEQWRRSAELVLADPNTEVEQIGETTSPVYVKGSEFTRNVLIFKERKNLEEIVEEIENADQIRQIIKDVEEYETIDYVAAFPHRDGAVGVMKRAEGKTLWEMINTGHAKYSHFAKAVDYLAMVHANMSRDQERIETTDKLESCLTNPELNLSEELQSKFRDNYTPITNSLESSIYVFNKDAHPENWMFTDKKLIGLDNECKGLVAQQLDLVNLMEYGEYITWDDKERLLMEYVRQYNKHSDNGNQLIEDPDKFVLGYLNGVVHRAIALSSAWSSVHRKSMWDRRYVIIDNALDAIDRIESEYAEYYSEYAHNYDGIRQGLREYSDHLSGLSQ
ncbi:MAG: hypothetical protein KKG59_02170 [Nanoarchaeota archaeon]|nr:hypothetical protein [Nanoarchaeota archaeon]